jgi:predicted membrane-bound mannosyltransferase
MLTETTAYEAPESIETQPPPRTAPGLTLPLARLSVADGLYLLVVLAAAVIRLTALGQIPLAPTEAKEALAAWQFLQVGQSIVEFDSPAYFTLTALLLPFFGTSDVTARMVAVLFGLGLVLLPWFLRDQLGRIGALVTAALFAVSPLYTTVSRTAGGQAIALFAIMLAAVAALRLQNGRGQHWLYVLAIALALGLTSSPLIYSGLITLAIAWWLQRKISPESKHVVWPEREELIKALAVGTVLFFALSTYFLTHLSGIGAAAQLLGDWLAQFSLQGDLQALLTPFLVLARYEIVLLPLGIFGILWSIWRNHPLGTLFTYWLLTGLILILLQRGVINNGLLVPLPGYLLLGLTTNHLLRRGLTRWTWATTGILVLLGAVVLVNIARFLRVSLTEQQILNL